jgi:hypothetical protein
MKGPGGRLFAPEPRCPKFRPIVFFGSPDMLLGQVKSSLEPKKYDEHEGLRIVLVDQAANAASLTRQLKEGKVRRCFVVSHRLRWDAAWIDAVQRTAGDNSVVFVGNLDHAWRIIVEDPKGLRQLGNLRIETLAPLAPIEIDDQIQRRKIKLSNNDRSALLAATGGFLQSLGHWTDRFLGSKRDSASGQDVCPCIEPIPESAPRIALEFDLLRAARRHFRRRRARRLLPGT